MINLNQTIQIIQKGDFWGKNRRFLAFQAILRYTFLDFFCEIKNWSGFAGIAYDRPLCRNGAIMVINML
jgi:hypothetical protein